VKKGGKGGVMALGDGRPWEGGGGRGKREEWGGSPMSEVR